MNDRPDPSLPDAEQDLPRVVDALVRLGEALAAVEERMELPMDALVTVEQRLIGPLLATPSGWLNTVCQAIMADDVPDLAMEALRWTLDRALLRVSHEGQAWSIHALNGRLQRRAGEPLPVVLDGLVEQADDLSLRLTGDAGRVRLSVQYFTSSTAFPYPEINTWTAALSSLGMPLIDRDDLGHYNALAMDEPNPSDDTPLDATHAMLLVAVRLDGLAPDRRTAILEETQALPDWPIAYRVGHQARAITLMGATLAPVFASQGTLSCRDDVEAMDAFVRAQGERLGGSWDGVVAFLYPTHTLDATADVQAMDVHHLQTVNVVLWAERLEMLIGGWTTRALPGPAVMRLLGSLSGRLSERGVPSVLFLPPQAEAVMDSDAQGRRQYLTPAGLLPSPVV